LASRPRTRKKNPAKPKSGQPQDFGETCLHMHCQQWLEKSGIWRRLLIFHVPNERKGGIGAIMHFKRMGVLNGVADYLAFAPSGEHGFPRRAMAVEIKDEEGEQRKGQQDFEKRWTEAGNVYVVVRTLEEFQGAVNALVLFA
jgi:hypothetical protein